MLLTSLPVTLSANAKVKLLCPLFPTGTWPSKTHLKGNAALGLNQVPIKEQVPKDVGLLPSSCISCHIWSKDMAAHQSEPSCVPSHAQLFCTACRNPHNGTAARSRALPGVSSASSPWWILCHTLHMGKVCSLGKGWEVSQKKRIGAGGMSSIYDIWKCKAVGYQKRNCFHSRRGTAHKFSVRSKDDRCLRHEADLARDLRVDLCSKTNPHTEAKLKASICNTHLNNWDIYHFCYWVNNFSAILRHSNYF